MRRKGNQSPLANIRQPIALELNGPGKLLGYRTMTRRLRRKYNLLVGRHTVRSLLKNIDPHGVNQRRQRRFERRQYRCPGTNAVWHIDGYDKLALSGFCISGWIDGYSRRIMFLQVASINHDPWILGRVFGLWEVFRILGRVFGF